MEGAKSTTVEAPTSLAATTITGNSIALVWSAPTAKNKISITGYEVVYSGPSGESQTALVKSSIPIITITKLQPCTFYSISVRAVGTQTGGGKIESDLSEPLEIMTTAGTPEPIDSVTVTPINDETVEVVIKDNLNRNCATPLYTVSIRNSDTQFLFASSTLPGKTFVFNGLKSGQNYASASVMVSVQTGTESSNRPNAPTGLSATGSTASSIGISWKAPDTNVTGYAVTYSSESSSGFVRISNAVETSFTITSLNPCTKYTIRLQSINNVSGADLLSRSSSSDVVQHTANAIPSTPHSVTISQLDYTSMLLTISDRNLVTCGSIVYSVEVFVKRNGRIIKIYNALLEPVIGSTVTLLNLNQTIAPEFLAGYTYFARVAAQDITVNIRGFVVVSPDLYMVPPHPAPNSPTGLKSGTVTANTVSLSWTAPTSLISGYRIVYTDPQGFASIHSITSATDSDATLTDLFPCTQYTIYIIALSKDTNPIPSQPSNIIIINTRVMTTSLRRVVLTQTSSTTASLLLFGKLPICPSTYLMTLTTNGIAGEPTSSIDRRKLTQIIDLFL
ncbi:fibronectin 1 [Cichlidogyrus casuarinus]|uniref:Fibronectin 1 n=1 Tax=Cichlidogyrus casuarinus TaxID=1844966 RepID=A0ABD2PR00_9PLAT